MNIIIAPDKFKGSLTSMEVCMAIREGILRGDENIEVSFFPMADGGDGFAEVMKYYTATTSKTMQSVDPLGRSIVSSYEWSEEDHIAIIELAACSGLAMLKREDQNPLMTSTYGTGLQMRHAIENGAQKIVLGIGGSATNDAGLGILCALGFIFEDEHNMSLKPCGLALSQIRKIVPPVTLPQVQVVIACDVNSPLYGPQGAAIIFSPQKGANPQQVQVLDDGLRHFAKIIQQQTGKDVSKFPGAGAAGGIAAGLMAFLPVTIMEGTQLLLKASKIEDSIKDASIIITGEGKLDQQSLQGKTICAISALAKEKNIPLVALCGKLDLSETAWREFGLSLAVAINDGSILQEESIRNARLLLIQKSEALVPLLRNMHRKIQGTIT